MRWRDTSSDWKQRFAFLPICVGGHWYWLEWYWERFMGDCYETIIGKGRDELTAALAKFKEPGQ